MSSSWFIYIIEYRNNFLYTGITTNIQRRFAEHETGGKKAAKALRGKKPLKLVFHQQVLDRSEATQIEFLIKKLSKQQKLKIIKNGYLNIDLNKNFIK